MDMHVLDRSDLCTMSSPVEGVRRSAFAVYQELEEHKRSLIDVEEVK